MISPIHTLLAAALLLTNSGCGSGPTVVKGTEPSLPSASGPVITVEGDYPYTVQGVQAGTNPLWGGTPAPNGQTYAQVLVEVTNSLTDRPIPALGGPPVRFQASRCEYSSDCFGTISRLAAYQTRDQLLQGATPETEDPEQLLDPGVRYYATLAGTIPADHSLDDIKLCLIRDATQCLPVGPLPRFTATP
jgi:hypothetical protein